MTVIQTRCQSIGIEYDERIYSGARNNIETAASSSRVKFLHRSAEKYIVPEEADRFYFFNPFSVEILRSVIERIKESYYMNPREMMLFFCYPSDEYISFLMTVPELEFMDEIHCGDLFEGENQRERIMIFSM